MSNLMYFKVRIDEQHTQNNREFKFIDFQHA